MRRSGVGPARGREPSESGRVAHRHACPPTRAGRPRRNVGGNAGPRTVTPLCDVPSIHGGDHHARVVTGAAGKCGSPAPPADSSSRRVHRRGSESVTAPKNIVFLLFFLRKIITNIYINLVYSARHCGEGGLVVLARATRNHGSRPPGLVVSPREPVITHHRNSLPLRQIPPGTAPDPCN